MADALSSVRAGVQNCCLLGVLTSCTEEITELIYLLIYYVLRANGIKEGSGEKVLHKICTKIASTTQPNTAITQY